jgi:hypothetical protein
MSLWSAVVVSIYACSPTHSQAHGFGDRDASVCESGKLTSKRGLVHVWSMTLLPILRLLTEG